jgi:hypothetical protein
MPSLKYADFFNMVRRRILLAQEREPVAAGELSSCSSPLADGVPCFFLTHYNLQESYLQFSATSLAQFASCVVHDWSGLRIVFCPTRKREPPGLKFLAFAVERCRINAEKHRQYLRVYVTHLRQKIEADSTKPRLIKTEPGIGYRFEAGEA